MIAYVPPELEDLIPWFIGNMKNHIESIGRAVERGDFETARFIGHDMKGVGKSYGFSGVSELGAKIETAAKANEPENICRCLCDFSDYIENVEIVVCGE
jgi:hypothetical protein